MLWALFKNHAVFESTKGFSRWHNTLLPKDVLDRHSLDRKRYSRWINFWFEVPWILCQAQRICFLVRSILILHNSKHVPWHQHLILDFSEMWVCRSFESVFNTEINWLNFAHTVIDNFGFQEFFVYRRRNGNNFWPNKLCVDYVAVLIWDIFLIDWLGILFSMEVHDIDVREPVLLIQQFVPRLPQSTFMRKHVAVTHWVVPWNGHWVINQVAHHRVVFGTHRPRKRDARTIINNRLLRVFIWWYSYGLKIFNFSESVCDNDLFTVISLWHIWLELFDSLSICLIVCFVDRCL